MEQIKPLDMKLSQRLFEQGSDSVSFYSDFTQVVSTGHEIVFQFYETIPGVPDQNGAVQIVRSRLRATITVSKQLAINFANNLLTASKVEAPKIQATKTETH